MIESFGEIKASDNVSKGPLGMTSAHRCDLLQPNFVHFNFVYVADFRHFMHDFGKVLKCCNTIVNVTLETKQAKMKVRPKEVRSTSLPEHSSFSRRSVTGSCWGYVNHIVVVCNFVENE